MHTAIPFKRMLNRILLIMAISAASAASQAHIERLEDLIFYTEDYPPANYSQDGRARGYAVDMLIAASQLAGHEVSLKNVVVQPWARSYRATLTDRNAVLFSTARTKHREDLFRWVGPIADIRVVVMARKDSNIVINDPLEMANYTIGVMRDDVGEQLLLELGVPREAMQEASYVTKLAEQLIKKRIDLLAYSERGLYWWAREAGFDSRDFEPVYVLKEGAMYFAFNRQIAPELRQALQLGLDRLKQEKTSDGTTLYQQIIDRYR